MFPQIRSVLRSSLAVSMLAYGLGIALASTVTALGAYRLAGTVLSNVKSGAAWATPASVPVEPPAAETSVAEGQPAKLGAVPSRRAGSGRSTGTRVAQLFGSSSRGWGGRRARARDWDDEDRWDWGDDDDEEEEERGQYRQSRGTYRTLCVRLCDGFYFPINFSATRGRFDDDAKTCERGCPGQARLFVYPNPGGEVEDMVDLSGQSYRDLKAAFLYRTQYVPSCRCKPEPWSAEAKSQHRMYALQAAARKGDKQAKAELGELSAKMAREAPAPAASQAAVPAAGRGRRPSFADADEDRRPPSRDTDGDTTGRMGLGAKNPPRDRSIPWRRDPDWMARALGRQ